MRCIQGMMQLVTYGSPIGICIAAWMIRWEDERMNLVLQDWEKLSEGERHFVKCLGPLFFGENNQNISEMIW